MHLKNKRILFLTLLFCLVLTACGGSDVSSDTPAGDNAKGYKASFHDATFHEDKAEGSDDVKVDLSATSDGYFGVLASSDKRLKLQVFNGDDTFTYDIPQGKPAIYPFQCGDGEYTIKVMENVEDNKYYELYTTRASVSLDNSKAPYVRPNIYANYTKSSNCVSEAAKLAANASNESEFVDSVYQYICRKVSYDYDEAATVSSGYIPDPDEVMKTGKGICFDYASLAASMLRSQGIPTKIIFGYVAPDNLYHAWNMFYTDEKGWTTVEFSVNPGDWTRIDLTFSSNGANDKFIGDGSNYQDVYQF